MHLDQGKPFSGWLGIRVYEPVRQQNGKIVVFHFFGHGSREFAPKVHPQQLRPRQWAALVNRLQSFRDFCRIFGGQSLSLFVTAGDDDNDQRVFENFSSACGRNRRAAFGDDTSNFSLGAQRDEGRTICQVLGGFFRDFRGVCFFL